MTALTRLTSTELKLTLRDPMAAFFAVAFPAGLVAVLGFVPKFKDPNPDLGGLSVVAVYVPIAIVLSLAMLAVQFTPAVLAGYRERGILRRLSTTPVQPASLLGAQLISSFLWAVVASVLVLAVGRIGFAVALPQHFAAFAGVFVLVAGSLFAIGLFIAAVVPSGKAGNSVGTVLFFPLMFFAGLWVPREAMPGVLQTISDYTPLGAGEHALHDAVLGNAPGLGQVAVLVAYIVVFSVAAARLFRWE